jgi:hypothetical protein
MRRIGTRTLFTASACLNRGADSVVRAEGSAFVVSADAGIHFDLLWLVGFAISDTRPCVFPSAILAAGSLSLARARESNQREHALGAAPRLRRGFAAGGRVRPRGHPWPLVRIGAIPRAARVRGTRLVRPPSATALEGTQEQEPKQKLLRQGLPRSALPGPLSAAASRRRKSRDSDRRQDAGEFDVSTGTYCRRTP